MRSTSWVRYRLAFRLPYYVHFMAPPIRIEFAGALFHVTSRGDGQENVDRDESGDRTNKYWSLPTLVLWESRRSETPPADCYFSSASTRKLITEYAVSGELAER